MSSLAKLTGTGIGVGLGVSARLGYEIGRAVLAAGEAGRLWLLGPAEVGIEDKTPAALRLELMWAVWRGQPVIYKTRVCGTLFANGWAESADGLEDLGSLAMPDRLPYFVQSEFVAVGARES